MNPDEPPDPGADEEAWTHETADLPEVRLHYVVAGPADGDLVVLLHGFPECWYAWRHQLPALAAAGFRVVAPDMRGYNRSSKPDGVEAYGLDHLADDVAALVAHLGRESAAVVGHDWGGVVAMATALRRPAVVDRLVVLNAPYPADVPAQFSVGQALRSWYVALFQLPVLPERLLRARGFEALDRLFTEGSVDDAYTAEDVAFYRRAHARPGALTAMVNYYRAFGRETASELARGRSGWRGGRVRCPTLVLWGERDTALGPGVLEHLSSAIPHATVRRFPGASHWLHAEFPEEVSEAIRTFLAGQAALDSEDPEGR